MPQPSPNRRTPSRLDRARCRCTGTLRPPSGTSRRSRITELHVVVQSASDRSVTAASAALGFLSRVQSLEPPCQCPGCPDKCGQDAFGPPTCSCTDPGPIMPAAVFAIETPRCRTVASRTDGRSPVHAEAARPAETNVPLAGCRIHHATRRLVRQPPPDRPPSASVIHQRTVTTSGRTTHH
jgi:hypothetical protein